MKKINNRKNEEGAAMVMVLMISMLLLVASAGLLLEATMNTANVTDATAEQQAYNAAESGIQSAINVLRGNTVASSLLDNSKPATDPVNRIDFRKAVTTSTSNLTGDTSTSARLSRWMNYNYTMSGSPVADRITLNTPYVPQSGYAFAVTVTDPDNTGSIISFNTDGKFLDSADNVWKSAVNIGTLPNLASLVYTSNSVSNLDVSGGSANTNFGSFKVTALGVGAVILTQDLRFQITVNMTAPYTTSKVMRGWLKAGTFSNGSVLKFDFDSPAYQLMGSTLTLNSDPLNINFGGTTAINGNMTQTEPYRIVINATGYGPRGAKKVLEATVQKNFFNGLSAPATLTLVGVSAGFVFNAGNSQNVTYSGDDLNSSVIIPSIGTTLDSNFNTVESVLNGRSRKADITGPPANVNTELPFWLQSTTNLNTTIESLKTVAKSSGRYYQGGQTPPDWGNNANASGITFADGNVSMSGGGGGILICTGKLTLRGGVDFNGLIIVTGAGGLDRSGGGGGTLQGNTVIAPYNPNNLAAGFLGPKYDISGGGNSEIVYNSNSVSNGMTAVSNFVLGVAEK